MSSSDENRIDEPQAVTDPAAMQKYTLILPVADEDFPDAHNVFLQVTNQRFCVTPHGCESKEQAEWFRDQLCVALAKIVEDSKPWRPIETATEEDKDGYVLGFVMGTDIPMIAFWGDDENRWFALNGAFKKEWNPTHFMRLP